MPSGTYRVSEREKNQSHQNDQSYRNCVITMLIFILLCIVIIATTWPLKSAHPDRNYVEKYDPRAGRRNGPFPSPTEATTEDSVDYVSSIIPLSDNESGKFGKYQAIVTDIDPSSTVNPEIEDNVKYVEMHSTTEETSIIDATVSKIEDIPVEQVTSTPLTETTSTPGLKSKKVDNFDSTYAPQFDSSTSEIPSTSTDIFGDNKRTTASEIEDFTSLKRLLVAKYFGNDSTTTEDPSNLNWLDGLDASTTIKEAIISSEKGSEFSENTPTTERQATSTMSDEFVREENQIETETDKTTMDYSSSSVFDFSSSEIPSTTPDTLNDENGSTTSEAEDFTSLKRLIVAKYFGNESSTTEDPSNLNWLEELDVTTADNEAIIPTSTEKTNELSETTTPLIQRVDMITNSDNLVREERKLENFKKSDLPNNICVSGRCKQQSSKMLAWMNHSADPCEDFYEYACGGLEADPEMIIIDRKTQIFSVIKERMINEKKEGKSSKFYDYYQSCMNTEKYTMEAVEILLNETLENIGKFYTPDNWPNDSQGITELILNLLQYDRPILFDITPEISENDSSKFLLRVGPPLPSTISSIFGVDDCNPGPSEQKFLNLDEVYNSYEFCRNNRSNLLKFINNTLHTSGYINGNIDLDLIEELLSIYPPENEIREAYRSKNYTTITLGVLENHSTLLHWTQLIYNLTGIVMGPDTELQLYFVDNLVRALHKIESLGQKDLLKLNNAILGLYAGNLYNEVLKSDFSRDQESKCLKIAARFLPYEASRLYISSFDEDHLKAIKSQVSGIFDELKKTLKLKFEQIDWAYDEGQQRLINKLNGLQISMPQLTYSNDNYYSDIKVDNNFFFNTIHLMRKSRERMYNILTAKPNTPEILWTHLAKAHEPQPQTIFALNLILVPLGAIQVSKLTQHNENYDYSTLASIGNLLAHQITHFFDTNGIQYWNATRDSPFSFLHDNDFTKINYWEYINCHNQMIFADAIDFTIPGTDQHIKFTIPQQTLNERLSDAAGVRLAHETLVRLGVNSVNLPPWIDLDIHQLFYLAYAQTLCTKTPLSVSTVSLYRDPRLPSRLRVYAVAVNDRQIGRAFNCPEGSQVLPNYSCNIFPHLEIQNAEIGTA